MRCGRGWVCEAHPDRPWPHDELGEKSRTRKVRSFQNQEVALLYAERLKQELRAEGFGDA